MAATEDWSDDEIAILVEDEEVEMAASKRKEQNPETEVLASGSVADPDPYVFGPSSKNSRKNLDSYYIVISL